MGATFEVTTNNIPIAKDALESQVFKALTECGMVAEGYAKMLCPVDTGALRNSITYKVTGDECIIGTNMHYAPYIELGTGINYSGGRRTSWTYKDSQGNWHLTNGMKAQPFIKPAVEDHTSEYRSIIEAELSQ